MGRDLIEHTLMLGYLILMFLQIVDSGSHHVTAIMKMRISMHMNNLSEKLNMGHCSSGTLCK